MTSQNSATLKIYLLAFDDAFGGREQLQAFFTKSPDYIKNWISQFEHAILLASDRSAAELGKWLNENYPTGSFLITQIQADNKAGSMHPNVWHFLLSPGPAPSHRQSSKPEYGKPLPEQAG